MSVNRKVTRGLGAVTTAFSSALLYHLPNAYTGAFLVFSALVTLGLFLHDQPWFRRLETWLSYNTWAPAFFAAALVVGFVAATDHQLVAFFDENEHTATAPLFACSMVLFMLGIWNLTQSRAVLERTSTRYIAEFPSNLDELTALIRSARYSLKILVDHVAYGAFSNLPQHLTYKRAIRETASSVSVHIKAYDTTLAARSFTRQLCAHLPRGESIVSYLQRENHHGVGLLVGALSPVFTAFTVGLKKSLVGTEAPEIVLVWRFLLPALSVLVWFVIEDGRMPDAPEVLRLTALGLVCVFAPMMLMAYGLRDAPLEFFSTFLFLIPLLTFVVGALSGIGHGITPTVCTGAAMILAAFALSHRKSIVGTARRVRRMEVS